MVTFTEAIRNGFKNYFNFGGRSTRAEFWYWALFAFLVTLISRTLDSIFFNSSFTDSRPLGTHPFFTVIFLIALFFPTLTLEIRRLRDAGRYWFWLIIGLIPFVGQVLLIVFYCSPSIAEGWGYPTSTKNLYQDNKPKN